MIGLFVLVIIPIGLVILAIIVSLFTKNKFMNWLVSSFVFLSLYFAYLSDFKIPFYYLNPAYYKYQSECKKLPKPVVYDEDIWEIANNWDYLPMTTDKDEKSFYYSKKLKKKFYGSRDWEPKRTFEKTWWGEVTKINDFYGNKLFSTRTVYYFDGLVFRFGLKKIGFDMEDVSCTNAKKVLF